MPAPKGNCFNPNGPTKKEIDWKVFEEACSILCTQDEMEGLLRISKDTLVRRVKEEYGEDYAVVYKRFSAEGKQSLRRSQFKLAKKNAAMAIWLGKQHLDQKDTPNAIQVSEEVSSKFASLMAQLDSLQALAIPKNCMQ
jgi:hypothetical protein